MKVSIKVTKPLTLFDLNKWLQLMKSGMDELTQETQEDFKATTASWEEHNPQFLITKAHQEGDSIKSSVSCDDPLYVGLNNGMPAHDITAVNQPVLVFQSQYHRKTQPRSIGSGRSQSSGQWIRKVSVSHPGTEPGLWDEAIAAKHKDDLLPIAEKAFDEATK